MFDETPEIECPACDGYGFIPPQARMGSTEDCDECEGSGFRPMTQDEINDTAEAAYERDLSEPPVSLDEQHRAAWDEKRRLRA